MEINNARNVFFIILKRKEIKGFVEVSKTDRTNCFAVVQLVLI